MVSVSQPSSAGHMRSAGAGIASVTGATGPEVGGAAVEPQAQARSSTALRIVGL
jgi:hypothetical protein